MTKICPNCKAENIDTAEFCQNCGTELPKHSYSVPPASEKEQAPKGGNWWSRQTGLVKILSIVGVCCVGLIVIIALLAVFFPDATTFNLNTNSNTDLTQTFSQAGLTFNYPSDWVTSTVNYIDTSSSVVQSLGTYATPDNRLVLAVSKQDINGFTVQAAKDGTKDNIKTVPSAQVISETTKTVNGLTVYEIEISFTDSNNQAEKSLYAITGKDNQVAYYLQFIDESGSFNKDKPLMDSIINTIKVS